MPLAHGIGIVVLVVIVGVFGLCLFTGSLHAFPELLLFGLLSALSLLIYFLPAAIAVTRGHEYAVPIFALNLFFGWSIIGWVAALIWSLLVNVRE